jgi:hypothetical protein
MLIVAKLLTKVPALNTGLESQLIWKSETSSFYFI